MADKYYTDMERVLIEGVQTLCGDDGCEVVSERQEHHNKLHLLLDYEMNQLITSLEKQLEEQGREEVEL